MIFGGRYLVHVALVALAILLAQCEPPSTAASARLQGEAQPVGPTPGLFLPLLQTAGGMAAPTHVPTVTPTPTGNPTATLAPDPVPTATQPSGTPQPARPVTLVALGDSLTAGDGDDSPAGGGYPARIERYLQDAHPGSTVLNLGRSGWTSGDVIDGAGGEAGELPQALAQLGSAPGDKVAILWIGSNDLWYLYEYGPEPVTDEAEQADLASYTAHATHIVSALRGAGAVVLLGLMDDQSLRPVVADPPNPAEPAFPAISAADRMRMAQQVRRYNDTLRRIAAEHDAVVVDFFATDIFTNSATLAGDGNHPNAAGYDAIAALWQGALWQGALAAE